MDNETLRQKLLEMVASHLEHFEEAYPYAWATGQARRLSAKDSTEHMLRVLDEMQRLTIRHTNVLTFSYDQSQERLRELLGKLEE